MRKMISAVNEAISAVLIGLVAAVLILAGALGSALMFGTVTVAGVVSAQRGSENGAAAVLFEPEAGGLLLIVGLVAIGYLAVRVSAATRSASQGATS